MASFAQIRYNYLMETQSLSKTNPYLKDAQKRRALIRKQVIDSSAVEGIDPKRIAGVLDKSSSSNQ